MTEGVDVAEIVKWLIGSGAGLMVLRFALKPYIDKFNQMYSMLIYNGGGSMLDMVRATSDKVTKIEQGVEILRAENRASMYITSNPIFKTDSDGRCVFVNKMYQYYSGMTYTDCLGEGWVRAIHPDDQDRVFDSWRRAIASMSDFTGEYRVVQSMTGMIYHVECRATIVRSSQGEVLGSVGLWDVKKAEAMV